MPLMIRPKGNLDVPVVICDHCGEEIEDAKQGNYQWVMDPSRTIDHQVFFTHKKCCREFEAAHKIGGRWGASELQFLPIFLLSTLKVEANAARALAKRFDNQ